MHSWERALALGAAVAATGCATAPTHAPSLVPEVTIAIDTRAEPRPVSPLLYGIFFEDINQAGDGGLYAEMVRNRSFEDMMLPAGTRLEGDVLHTDSAGKIWFPFRDALLAWQAHSAGQATATVALDETELFNAVQRRSLRIESTGASADAMAGAVNEGFWGMAVEAGQSYDLALWTKAGGGFEGPIVARLLGADGAVLAEQVLGRSTGQWTRLASVLVPSATDAKARLAIVSPGNGRWWIDMVSLMPRDTWKQRPNGLRADLVERLAHLKPSFLRFPGGCFVEGFSPETAYRWKHTIGPIEERTGHYNLWAYRTSNGLGFHEFLLLAEDLDAEPMFVVNAGITCQTRGPSFVPMEELGVWIQDTLDAIEYANGPIDSPWGARRAAAGHPAPFGLRFLSIGNENFGPEYHERYLAFAKAIKARHPDIQLIATDPIPGASPDIIDEHYYDTPEFFLARTTLHDDRSRQGPRVYVGEYAVWKEAGKGNLAAALAEAAFMTGLERNSDLVVMASYAPLFCNTNHQYWVPNAIYFDGTRSYGTPSYHVQALFSRHRSTATLPCKMDPANQLVSIVAGNSGDGFVLKVVNASDRAVPARLQLMGREKRSYQLDWTTLSSTSPKDENTLDDPERIAPRVVEHASRIRGDFTRTLPPWSVNVMQIDR